MHASRYQGVFSKRPGRQCGRNRTLQYGADELYRKMRKMILWGKTHMPIDFMTARMEYSDQLSPLTSPGSTCYISYSSVSIISNKHYLELMDSLILPLIEIHVTRSLSSAFWVAWLFAVLVAKCQTGGLQK